MHRANRLPGHALQHEGKPYERGDEEDWLRTWLPIGVGLCQCGATSPELGSDTARKAWHRDVHKPAVRAQMEESND